MKHNNVQYTQQEEVLRCVYEHKQHAIDMTKEQLYFVYETKQHTRTTLCLKYETRTTKHIHDERQYYVLCMKHEQHKRYKTNDQQYVVYEIFQHANLIVQRCYLVLMKSSDKLVNFVRQGRVVICRRKAMLNPLGMYYNIRVFKLWQVTRSNDHIHFR